MTCMPSSLMLVRWLVNLKTAAFHPSTLVDPNHIAPRPYGHNPTTSSANHMNGCSDANGRYTRSLV
ncbi:MAG: hypothetical protein GY796_27745 [Chloroflexi bacterium]|nr:hypothetical protein [Chloroflexota bacterium]